MFRRILWRQQRYGAAPGVLRCDFRAERPRHPGHQVCLTEACIVADAVLESLAEGMRYSLLGHKGLLKRVIQIARGFDATQVGIVNDMPNSLG